MELGHHGRSKTSLIVDGVGVRALKLGSFSTTALTFVCLAVLPAVAGDSKTQIVVQWLIDGDAGLSALASLQSSEVTLEKTCGQLCFVDGNDFGSGTGNIFIYAADADVERTVKAIISSGEAGELPPGMRIGIAQYKDDARTDWTFAPAFPAGLSYFNITY